MCARSRRPSVATWRRWNGPRTSRKIPSKPSLEAKTRLGGSTSGCSPIDKRTLQSPFEEVLHDASARRREHAFGVELNARDRPRTMPDRHDETIVGPGAGFEHLGKRFA